MAKRNVPIPPAVDAELQEKALKALRNGDFDFALKALQRGDANVSEMVEDLKIYQAELEIQNEELRHASLLAENAMQRFSLLFTALPLPALVIDSLKVVLECNDEAERLFKLQHSHLRSHFLPSLVQKQDHGRLQQCLTQAEDLGQASLLNVGMRAADKSVFIGDLHAALLPDVQTKEVHLVVSIVDQTQNLTQRSQLEASRRHFMAYFQAAPMGMAATSPSKGWLEVNGKLCDMLGYSEEALVRMTWQELTHPDDVAADLAQFEHVLAGDSDGYQMDKRFVRRDGSILDAHIAVNALRTFAGAVDYCVAIVEDISERKQAERELLKRDQAMNEQALQLRERVKELKAIYAISSAAHSLNDEQMFFEQVLNIIPPGMLYPEHTQVRIQLHGRCIETAAAGQMLACLRTSINMAPGVEGELIVGYDQALPTLDEGPFFHEERDFVNGVAGLIARFCHRMSEERARNLAIRRNQALLRLTNEALNMDEKDLLSFTLEQVEILTESRIAYLHFVNPDQETLTLGGWSSNALQQCEAAHDNHYPISQAGVWADCFRQRHTVLHNDYPGLSVKRGLPDGHAKLVRHMSTPVLDGDQVTMIMGVGNKAEPYDDGDKIVLEMFAANTWALLQRNRSQHLLEMHAQVFRASREAVMIADQDNLIMSVNDAFCQITGYSAQEAIGQKPSLLKSGRHNEAFYQTMWHSIQTSQHWQGEIWNRRKNGEIYPQWLGISAVKTAQGSVSGYIGVFMDISEYKETQQRIEHLAHHDPLTGLPNRTLLRDRFHQIRAFAIRQECLAGMLYLDLDHFKNINDSMGHPAGDELLLETARRLKECVRDVDTVSRIGGDEFVILLSEITAAENMLDISLKVLHALAEPFDIQQTQFNLSCSIGISIYPQDGDDFDTLLQKADTALYQAKNNGRNNYQFFTETMNKKIARRMQLDIEMRKGLELRQFFLNYQPQFELKSGKILGVEALLRWQHPTLGRVPPGEFIEIAEDVGFIIDLGNFVMREACLQAKKWLDQGKALVVAVNVSYAQFLRNDLLQSVRRCLQETGLPPCYLELELTESTLVADVEKVLLVVRALKAEGVRFSIDDFGTGYSSLSYLKRFALDKLKIDQSFLRDVPGDPDDEAIVKAVINLATSLNMGCIAEGVETQSQADFLAALGCQEVQGYLYARPLLAADVETLIEKLGSII